MQKACTTVFQVCGILVIRAVVSLPGLGWEYRKLSLLLWPQAPLLSSLPNLSTVASDLCLFDAVVKVPIVNHLEFLRDEELEERREKRRKQLAEEETKITDKSKEDKENRDQSAQVIPKDWVDSFLSISAVTFLWFYHILGTKPLENPRLFTLNLVNYLFQIDHSLTWFFRRKKSKSKSKLLLQYLEESWS
jgi:hypothetical protein